MPQLPLINGRNKSELFVDIKIYDGDCAHDDIDSRIIKASAQKARATALIKQKRRRPGPHDIEHENERSSDTKKQMLITKGEQLLSRHYTRDNILEWLEQYCDGVENSDDITTRDLRTILVEKRFQQGLPISKKTDFQLWGAGKEQQVTSELMPYPHQEQTAQCSQRDSLEKKYKHLYHELQKLSMRQLTDIVDLHDLRVPTRLKDDTVKKLAESFMEFTQDQLESISELYDCSLVDRQVDEPDVSQPVQANKLRNLMSWVEQFKRYVDEEGAEEQQYFTASTLPLTYPFSLSRHDVKNWDNGVSEVLARFGNHEIQPTLSSQHLLQTSQAIQLPMSAPLVVSAPTSATVLSSVAQQQENCHPNPAPRQVGRPKVKCRNCSESLPCNYQWRLRTKLQIAEVPASSQFRGPTMKDHIQNFLSWWYNGQNQYPPGKHYCSQWINVSTSAGSLYKHYRNMASVWESCIGDAAGFTDFDSPACSEFWSKPLNSASKAPDATIADATSWTEFRNALYKLK